MNKEYNLQREKFWCDVYVAYVNASNSTEFAKKWADIALQRFDERFPPKIDIKQD